MSVCACICVKGQCLIVLFDEMKVREDLVFQRDGHIIGFVDAGDFNNKLRVLERQCNAGGDEELATHVLTLMVHSIFIHFQFPYAHFPNQRYIMN